MKKLRLALESLLDIPRPLDISTNAVDVIRLVLRKMGQESVAHRSEAPSVELLGWLELPLDLADHVILTSLNERRREMAILRAVGARPWHVLLLMISESALLAACGVLAGMGMIFVATAALAPALERRFGIFVEVRWPGAFEWLIAALVLVAAVIVSLWPAWRAYRNALADGLTIRV